MLELWYLDTTTKVFSVEYSTSRLRILAEKFFADLLSVRERSAVTFRPLILLAHSVRGLVIKQVRTVINHSTVSSPQILSRLASY